MHFPGPPARLDAGDRYALALLALAGIALVLTQAILFMNGRDNPGVGLLGALCLTAWAHTHSNGRTVV